MNPIPESLPSLPSITLIAPLSEESEALVEIEPTPAGDVWRALREQP